MKILINGKEEKVESNITILKLLEKKNIRKDAVEIELNRSIINKKDYDTVYIKDGDKLELIFYMGGGK